MVKTPRWRFVICDGCAGDGAGLAKGLDDLGLGVEVAHVACLSVCADPVTVAAQGEGRATYVFSGLGPGHLGDLAAFAESYAAAPAGWIEDARPLGDLRFRLVTRVPAQPGSGGGATPRRT